MVLARCDGSHVRRANALGCLIEGLRRCEGAHRPFFLGHVAKQFPISTGDVVMGSGTFTQEHYKVVEGIVHLIASGQETCLHPITFAKTGFSCGRKQRHTRSCKPALSAWSCPRQTERPTGTCRCIGIIMLLRHRASQTMCSIFVFR